MATYNDELAILRDLEVSAVCFVRDYVELHFDGPVLRALADPEVWTGSHAWSPHSPGWRDALCELIGRAVLDVQDCPDVLRLDLTGDLRILVPKESTTSGPEVAHFIPADEAGALLLQHMIIWENEIPSAP